MKKIAFQSYLDCLYGGVQRRFYSNVLEIQVEENGRITPTRKSIKIPYAPVSQIERRECCQKQACRRVDLLIVLALCSCL